MKILVINGPNLNRIQDRDPDNYGLLSLVEIEDILKKKYPKVEFSFHQSNHEGTIIDILQSFEGDGVIINPGAFTHTSIAIRDCLEYIDILKVEVHLSDFTNREDFRKINYISEVVSLTIAGHHHLGYIEAVDYIIKTLKNKGKI
jgi:3-dehydroquinate dehydratase-2